MEDLILEIAKQGGFAIVATLAVVFAIKKDKQVSALYDRLERKSDKYVEQYSALSKELNETLAAMSEELGLKEE